MKHGFGLTPGSSINGKPYTLERDLETWAIPDAPPALHAMACTRKASVAATAPANCELDRPENVARFEAKLENLPLVTLGNGADARTYEAGCYGREQGLSEAKVAEVMLAKYKCEPQDERYVAFIESKVRSAFAYGQNAAGAYAVPDIKETFKGFESESAPTKRASLMDSARSFGDVMARTVPHIQEILSDYIEKGLPTFLAGRGESFKSLYALQIAMYVAAGLKLLGRQPMAIALAVVLTSEDGRDEVDRRLKRIAARSGITGDIPLKVIDRVGIISALVQMFEGGTYELLPFWFELTEYLKAIIGHKFVVLDSCLDYVSFAGKAKIDEGAVNAFIKGILQRLCDECDCTLLVIWHPSQAGQDRGDASGWSVAWHNAPRARISMTAVKDVEGAVELKVEKRSHGKKPKPVVLHWNAGAMLPLTEGAASDQEAALMDAVVRVALMAANTGAPLQMQKHLQKWQLDEIERAIGRRPSQREVKDTLAAALPAHKLRYISSSRHRCAGYYPPDQERAEALAREAKKHGGEPHE